MFRGRVSYRVGQALPLHQVITILTFQRVDIRRWPCRLSLALCQQQDDFLLNLPKHQLLERDQNDAIEFPAQPGTKFSCIFHLKKLCGHNHRESPTCLEKLNTQLYKRHPGIGQFSRRIPGIPQVSKRRPPTPVIEILKPDERWVTHDYVKPFTGLKSFVDGEEVLFHPGNAAATVRAISNPTHRLLNFFLLNLNGHNFQVTLATPLLRTAALLQTGKHEISITRARLEDSPRASAQSPPSKVISKLRRCVITTPELLPFSRLLVSIKQG